MENIKNKVTVKDLGEPKKVLGLDGDKARHVLGTIVGIATNVQRRTNRNDPTRMDEALVGDFKAIPAKITDEFQPISSGVCYLPSGAFNKIASILEGENAPKSVRFVMEVATVKDKNAAGYTYSLVPKLAEAGENPLDALLKEAKIDVPAISAPSARK